MGTRITIILNDLQEEALEELMAEDLETNRSAYIARFIGQEKQRREDAKGKKGGRPRKEKPEEDTNLYPAPYKGGGVYTRDDWEGYFEFRGEEVPPLPKPLTKEELKGYGQ